MEFFEYLPGGLAAVAMVFRIAILFRPESNDSSNDGINDALNG